MRMINTHITHEQCRQPDVYASGVVGAGGAEMSYRVCYEHPLGPATINIEFMGVDRNGFTNEALLAIVIDRLEGFQAGKFACTENAAALDHARICLGELKERTRSRVARDVQNQEIK